MAQDLQESDKTTANTPVSDISPGGTRPPPSDAGKAAKPTVQSGDQNANPARGTND